MTTTLRPSRGAAADDAVAIGGRTTVTTTTTTITTTTTNTTLQQRRSNLPALVCAFSASATTGGTTYAFGLYAAALKQQLHFNQSEMDSISTAFFLAGLCSWLPGLFVDRYGTRLAMITGGCLGATALMGYWAVATQQRPADGEEVMEGTTTTTIVPHEWLVPILSSLGIVIFSSCGMVTGAVFKIIVASTGPGRKGSAVGAAKGYVGLGAGLYACLFNAIRTPNESELDFLPMAAWFFLACAVVPALCLLPHQQEMDRCVYVDDSTVRHFRTLYLSLTVLAAVIILTSMMDLYGGGNNAATTTITDEPRYGRAFLLVAIWLAPIHALQYLPRVPADDDDDDGNNAVVTNATTIPTRSSHVPLPMVDDEDDDMDRRNDSKGRTTVTQTGEATNELDDSHGHDNENLEGAGLLSSNRAANHTRMAEAAAAAVDGDDADDPAVPNSNLNLLQMLRTPSAWLLLWTATILVGAGTVVTNHMGQMVQSLGFATTVTSAAMALFSVAQAAGRVATGSISEAAMKYVPRPTFLVVASVVGLFAHLLMGFARSEVVFVAGATLSGAAFGMVWPLLVLIIGEVFGTAHVGANYMFVDGFASAAGTLLMTKLIAQDVYESHISPRSDDPTTCLGMGCFQETHLAAAGLSMTCIVTSWMLLIATRQVYRRIGHTA
jgi:MFS family permease